MIVQVIAAVLLAATPLHADAKVTWTVQPADGSRWIERTLDPGQTVTEKMVVRNLGATDTVFALSAADGYLTDKGHFNMLASDQKSTDGGTWITVQSSVAVGAGKTQTVPFTITVPAGAAPGDHPAGIAASVLSRNGTVQVESRVGFRVMLRASGTVRSTLAAQHVTARYSHSWNPFRSGSVEVRYTLANTGNVRADARTSLSVSELFGIKHRDGGAAAGELLPGGARPAGGVVHGVWGLGPVHAKILLSPADPAGPADVTVWVVPWPQLLVVVLLVVLVLVLRARRRRFARLLADARQESRKDPHP
jgi:hypothetical protein